MNEHVHPIFREILNTAKEILPTADKLAERVLRKAEKQTEAELDKLDKAGLDEKAPDRQEVVRSGDNVYIKLNKEVDNGTQI